LLENVRSGNVKSGKARRGEFFRSRGETAITIYSAEAKIFSKKIVWSLKEELPYIAVLRLDGVVAAYSGD
jgi:CRISPR/Cas system CMR subunit Cmr6 (Cas7 group RAMP superfamily)